MHNLLRRSTSTLRLVGGGRGRCHSTKGGGTGGTDKGSRTTMQKSSASTATSTLLQQQQQPPRERKKGVPLDVPLFPPDKNNNDAVISSPPPPAPMAFNAQVTTLESGLKVGSTFRYGKYCTIGVAIRSGSRYEAGFTKGLSHLVEKLGFTSSRSFREKSEIMSELEKFGAICDAQTARDTTVYAISTEVTGIEKLMKLLADVVLRPQITEEELLSAQQTVQYELEDMQMRPEQEQLILEMIHSAAWKDNSLGFPRYCPSENAERVTRKELLEFMSTNYTPDKMAVAGVGVDHKLLVDLTKEYFDSPDTTWNNESVKGRKEQKSDGTAIYTGGDNRVMKDFGQFNAGPLPVPKLAHMALGIQSVAYTEPGFIAACVLNILMGGGGSFSAGGPGKGMYSRLYTNVLNTKHWVYNATAYNNSYSDSGLFCIYGSAPPEYMSKMTEVLIHELHGMAEQPDDEEFERAKKQLQSMLLMNLESRPVVFEDIGRQLLAHGYYKPPTEYLEQIEKVSKQDIVKLAQTMLKSKPSLAALGDISKIPKYMDIMDPNEKLRNAVVRLF